MSYTTVYTMPPDRPLIEIGEFQNAWGSAWRVWMAVADKYLGPLGSRGLLSGGDDVFKTLWNLHDDPRLTRAEKAVLVWTYDKAVVEADQLGPMTDCFDEFEKLHPVTDRVSHLPALAKLYREYRSPCDILGLCVCQTSVAGDVWYRSSSDDEESHLYDASRDNDHFFVFASLSQGGQPQ